MKHPFKGRTLTVISDLNREERLYLFQKTKQLKKTLKENNHQEIDKFRINDNDFGIYEVFLEDSTRTKESFRNAISFLNAKLSELNPSSSSINKSESYADTFNNLTGYNNKIFIVRSKLEGVCRWLEESTTSYSKRNNMLAPSFINAGDGAHEHPTQELLDEFTFLEDNDWSLDYLHIALIGDLFHGRTAHSKANGLTLFKKVKIDIIAPETLMMPKIHLKNMESNGFEVSIFENIDSYLQNNDIASKWYFTRPQLERMGDNALKNQDILRNAITIKNSHLSKLPKDTLFYHPLPRHKKHPVIPTFLDDSSFNAWERQSANGMLIRIVLLAMTAGKVGDDYKGRLGQKNKEKQPFIKKIIVLTNKKPKKYSEGIIPINDGIVIDHIYQGESCSLIRQHLTTVVSVLNIEDGKGGEWITNTQNNKKQYKGIIFRPNHKGFNQKQLKKLAGVAPGCTLNIIKKGIITEKYKLKLPPRIYNMQNLSCQNKNCISHPTHFEPITSMFHRSGSDGFTCHYCESFHTFKEIWK